MINFVTPFPFLLDFALYSPILLRITLGIFVLAIGFSSKKITENAVLLLKSVEQNISDNKIETVEKKVEQKQENISLNIFESVFRILLMISGIMVIIGFYTQIGALIITILLLLVVLNKKLINSSELNKAELVLLIIISLSLMTTGAGPFAFDLPL